MLIETTHDPVPEQGPDQPTKVDAELGAAVNVTVAFVGYRAEIPGHVALHEMPEGELVIVPAPKAPEAP
jgi:hypothetical protein